MNRYTALPIQDEESSGNEISIPFKIINSAYCINRKDIKDARELEAFLRQHQASIPTFSMTFKGYRPPHSIESLFNGGRSNSSNDANTSTSPSTNNSFSDQFQIFEFSVPLPSQSKSNSILYSRSDDVPCQRGEGLIPEGKTWLDIMEKFYLLGENGFSIEAGKGTQLYDSQTGLLKRSNDDVRKKWNSRVQKLLKPWIGLEEKRGNDDDEIDDKNQAERTLSKNLKRFLNDKSRSKWLICPQTVYNWDSSLISNEIRKLIPDEYSELNNSVGHENSSHQPALISHVKVSIDSPPPFIVIRVSSNLSTLTHSLLGVGPELILYCFLAFLFLFGCNVFIFSTCSDSKECWEDNNPGPFTLSFWLINLISLIFMVFCIIGIDTNRRYDLVGLAWSLKGLKKSKGETHVLGNGNGTDELEWFEKHSDRLRIAIKERRNGDLSNEWPED